VRVTKEAWAKGGALACLVTLDAGPLGGVLHARSGWIDPAQAPAVEDD
jgi:hypothetical protein